MKTYLISQELAQKILTYLGTKPFVEVHQLVPGLLSLEELPTTGETNEAQEAVTPEVVE